MKKIIIIKFHELTFDYCGSLVLFPESQKEIQEIRVEKRTLIRE